MNTKILFAPVMLYKPKWVQTLDLKVTGASRNFKFFFAVLPYPAVNFFFAN